MGRLSRCFRRRPIALFPAVLALFVWLGPSAGWSASREHPFGSRIFVKVAQASRKTVVNISTTDKVRGWKLPRLRRFLAPWKEREKPKSFFDRFAPDFGPQSRRDSRHSLGSGFIVDPKGYILTNYHVVERSGAIHVTLEDRSEYTARIIGADPQTDIALLKIDAGRALPAGRLGNSDRLEVGEWVMAIGSPFGLAHTITVGVVSAKGRVIGSGPLDDYIQTDAYINVGNSGGPLVNTEGEVVGMNTAIVAESLGIGFAIPINIAKAILRDLRIYGRPRRGWLGVSVREMDPQLAKTLGLSGRAGAWVSGVARAGPAETAGIRKGDVIVEFNGRPIREKQELLKWVATARPGSRARLKVFRKGRRLEVAVYVRAAKDGRVVTNRASRQLGLQVTPMTGRLARRMRLDRPRGVVVSSVQDGSPAQEGGLQEGDVILEINRRPVRDVNDYRRLIRRAAEEKSVLLLIRRNQNSIFLALRKT
ncbi:MAG: Do family serine endopeptidase [Nitrospinota bacterium]